MRKFAVSFVAWTILLSSIGTGCFSCFAVKTRSISQIVYPTTHAREERARTVQLVVMCGVRMGFGSGAVIDDRRILTARHVVVCRDGSKAFVMYELANGDTGAVNVVDVAEDADVAVVETVGESLPFPTLKFGTPKIDTVVCASTAFPDRTRKCGIVQQVIEGGEFRMDLIGDFGNSGSAIYNERGELIGVLVKLTRASNGQHDGSIGDARISIARKGR